MRKVAATEKELSESIEALKRYRDRLRTEIINISRKLRISQNKIESELKENHELKDIENALQKLIHQKANSI